jgi:hypothetical protein
VLKDLSDCVVSVARNHDLVGKTIKAASQVGQHFCIVVDDQDPG